MSIISYIGHAIEAITGFNECVNFLQLLRSLRSHSNGTESQELKEDDVQKLLEDTVSKMRNLFNQAEWKSHEKCVEVRRPELQDAMHDAEDLLDNFKNYKPKVQIGGNATSLEPATKSFHDDIQDIFTKLTRIKDRLDDLSRQLEGMGMGLGLYKPTPRFDRSVRPETTSFPIEANIYGRDDEMDKLKRLLGVPGSNSRGPSRRKRPRVVVPIPVLPIVGIGGVGKTTLVQNLCSHQQVKKHFDVIVWICVSDDFDAERLTKEAIEQFSGKAPTMNNLNSLQTDLADRLNKRRCLIVLDDMWTENKELWKRFYAPFRHVPQGSMMLVTTRSLKVADTVRTMDPFLLEGLKDDVFLNFFKRCVFKSDSSNNNPELESIVEQILPKLKGSPLAAKTLGRLLGTSDPAHWKMILNSQLWQHKQEDTEIMPALRLSYIYLPFHLKQCFSFCAVYPKYYNFKKEDLAEIWVAEGFVEPETNIPPQQTGCKYFEELAHLSFFQKVRGKYVMHDLIHDMAQLVSKDNCFIIKEKNDLERIPQNIRHLSVLKSRDVELSDLESLCKQTKLRTLLCYMSLNGDNDNTVMEKWCTGLVCMRVMVFAYISKSGLPDSISNMKNLRYLKISDAWDFDSLPATCLPATFCHLYNLQVLSARKCRIRVIPKGFSNLIHLQKFESAFLKIDAGSLNNFSLNTRDLYICNLCEISKDQAAKIEFMKNHIFNLTLDWSKGTFQLPEPTVHNEIEVFEALQPPTDIKSVHLKRYPGEDLPGWFHGSSNGPTIFSSLREIRVIDCPRLSSLEQFLQPAYMPAIYKMVITGCSNLESVPVERFRDLPSLRFLEVSNCPKINSQRLLAPSLKNLDLVDAGNLGDDIDCRSLITFSLSRYHLATLTFNIEKVPLLTDLTIKDCKELETLNGGWRILEWMWISDCPRLKWENGLVLPSSLGRLHLYDCGYFSVRCLENLTSLKSLVMSCKHIEYIPRDLWSSNLKSLRYLTLKDCEDLVSIGGREAIEHIPDKLIEGCPKLKEVQQPLESGIICKFLLNAYLSTVSYDYQYQRQT